MVCTRFRSVLPRQPPSRRAAQSDVDRSLCDARRGSDDGRTPARVTHLADRDGRGAAREEVTRGDDKVEAAAQKLQSAADRAAAEGGIKGKLAGELAEDAAFVRKLKPSLMIARAKGQAPTDQPPEQGVVAPSGPQLPR